MPGEPMVCAIVVNRDRAELLGMCLDSLQAALAPDDDIVVVDNGSADASRRLVEERQPHTRLVALGENRGFGAAVNAGARCTRAPWLLLINNDARVEPGAIDALRRAGEADPGVWALGAQVRFAASPEILNSTGLVVDRLGVAADRGLGRQVADHGDGDGPHEVFGPSAVCALVRREAFERLGGFDECFFVFLEDVDLAWRARMHGWRSLYVPAAVAVHDHSATALHRSPAKHYWVGRNRVRLLAKHADLALLRRHGPAMLAYDLAYVAYACAADRTLAPLRGRLRGLREWRAVRRAYEHERRPVALAPPLGLRAARARRSAWEHA